MQFSLLSTSTSLKADFLKKTSANPQL